MMMVVMVMMVGADGDNSPIRRKNYELGFCRARMSNRNMLKIWIKLIYPGVCG